MHSVNYYLILMKYLKVFLNDYSRDPRVNGQQGDVSQWRNEIDQSKVVLFVISNDTRSLTSMILAAHYIGSGKDVVLCVEQLNSENCVIANETVIFIYY